MDEIITTLESISEQLGDRALQLLHDAVASGGHARPAGEKNITQARRAVEKAIGLLKDVENRA